MNAEINHQPLKGMLDRPLAIAQAKEINEVWSPYLEELVNFATNCFGRCEKSLKKIGGTPSALINLFYHSIQMADGIQELCKQSCFDAAVPLLRSLWEARLSVEYMLEKDFELRSAAWMACSYTNHLTYLRSLDGSSETGKKLQAMVGRDRHLGELSLEHSKKDDLREQVGQLEQLLSKEKFKKALKNMSTDNIEHGKWYTVNKGAKSLKKVAEQLNCFSEYHFIYGIFSSVLHATDATRMVRVDSQSAILNPLRSCRGAYHVYSITCSCLRHIIVLIAGRIRPEEKVGLKLQSIRDRHNVRE